LRDKFRMQHTASTGDNKAAGHDSDAAVKQADCLLSSATTEEIQSLDRSPQRGAVVRGRRESGSSTAAKTTGPSVDDSQRSLEVTSGSPEKKVQSQTTIRSPVQAACDNGVVTADHVSVISRGGETKQAHLPHSGNRRVSGHVSDSASSSRPAGMNDRRPLTGTRRSGYVSDTSFSAVVYNAANDTVRSTATEGA